MYNAAFARHYDALTANVNYGLRARYFHAAIKKYSRRKVRILLDLACGTGSMSWRFSNAGYDVIGVDCSPEMLAVAVAKGRRFPRAKPPLFLCQAMQELDLYGTVDACICTLDSINHLPDTAALKAVFDRVSLFLAPGGAFLFDVNTSYKHRNILGNNTFVYETENVVCLWRNTFHKQGGKVEVSLDFFERQASGAHTRSTEQFCERIFTHRQLSEALAQAKLKLIAVHEEGGFDKPCKNSQRLVYIAQKT